MTMAGERLAFLREIFLRRVAKSNDKRKAHRRSFSDLATIEDTLYICSLSIKTYGANLSLRLSSPG